jgi:hypothetical protein
MELESLPRVHWLQVPDHESLNARLLTRFAAVKDDPDHRRSHHFHGRYENLYIDRERIPEILPLIQAAERAALQILGSRDPLRCGFWFNAMGPGHRTTPHSHEEDDELLSAVYYVTVPEGSGDLLLYADPATIRVTPEPGLLVLFPPSVEHEVEENRSRELRLSVAFNFGPLPADG